MQTRLFTENKLVVATHNQGKLREIRALLADQGVTVLYAGELGLDEPEETEDGNGFLHTRKNRSVPVVIVRLIRSGSGWKTLPRPVNGGPKTSTGKKPMISIHPVNFIKARSLPTILKCVICV